MLELALKVIQTTKSFVCLEIFFDVLMNYYNKAKVMFFC